MDEEQRLIAITDLSAFFDQQTQSERLANRLLHPNQRAVTWGSYWVRFYDVPNHVHVFSKVLTVDEFRALEIASGSSEEELLMSTAQLAIMHEDGYMYGWCYSIVSPKGEIGSTHRYNLWPIPERIYNDAKENGWDVRKMNGLAQFNLAAIYADYRAWERRLEGGVTDTL